MKEVRIKTSLGDIEGLHGWDPRILVFKGVPYAKPPVGEFRFRSPRPMEPWEGVLKAYDYAPVAMQDTPGIDKDSFWTREMHPTGPEYEVSEDCLYLNIFTPARDEKAGLPVLFYIHGGGFTGGYPSEIEFDWEHMARKGMVVVAIQYRLGIFGFLASSLLSREVPQEGKGNYGIEDQICALRWVRENIRAFGGDPERITIAGQSAGAMSVQCLLSSPQTEGMIGGAIVESCIDGELPGMPVFTNTLEESEKIGNALLEGLGYHSLGQLRAVSAQRLLRESQEILGPGFHFRPTIDGRVLTESPFQSFRQGHHKRVPVLAGYNRGELSFFKNSLKDEMGMVEATRMFGHIQSRQGRAAYLYEFDGDIPGEDKIGSYHGSEMWFAYDSLARSDRPFTGRHYDLARQMSSYWYHFIQSGDPNGRDSAGLPLPRWEAFTPENDFLMLFKTAPDCGAGEGKGASLGKSPERTDQRTLELLKERLGE